jgi:hypothetical protein
LRESGGAILPFGRGSHSMRRTKSAQLHGKTGNLCTVQMLLDVTEADSTVLYLDFELEDFLSIAAGFDI